MTYETQFRKIEKKWQQEWEKRRAFIPETGANHREGGEVNKASLDFRSFHSRKKKKFFATVPYPYTSGPLHIGHGRTYTLADVFIRFQRMSGFNVLWPMGFHITGTPILAVSKRIAAGDADAIKTYTDYIGLYEKNKAKIKKILDSFSEPQNVADYFANVIISDFKSIGLSIDWTRRFTTGDLEYNKFVEWQFNRLKTLDLITKGEHAVLFCTSDKNAVGEDDIQNGDTIEAGIEEYTLLKFKLKDSARNEFLIAATLRPETVYGQTNLWVRPDTEYIKFKTGNEIWIGSREFFEKLGYQGKHAEETGKIKGAELIGKYAVAPGVEKEIIILPAKFPDPDIGSGIVTSVPGHSIADYAALTDLKKNLAEVKKYGLDYLTVSKIEPVSIIELPGFSELPAADFHNKLKISSQADAEKLEAGTKELYRAEFHSGIMKNNCSEIAGMKVSGAKEHMKKALIANNEAALFQEVSALSRPVKCRCGGKVVVSVLKDQWYINYGDDGWKENTRLCLEKMKILPESYRPMFLHTINWLHERACARLRGLGTKLPWDNRWIIESLSDSTIYTAFYTVINLIRKNALKPEQLTQKFWDYILLSAHSAKDVSKETGIKEAVLNELHDSFAYWYPVDLRHTAIGHISNHLAFYIFNHAALFQQKQWPVAVTLNEFVTREGAKMSKSKGNVVPLADIPKKYGADLYRLCIASSANLDAVVDWREQNILSARKRLNRFYGLADKIIKGYRKPQTANRKPKSADLWLKSKFNSMVRDITTELQNFQMRDYSQKAFFEFLNELSYYYKRSGREINYAFLYNLLGEWLKILAPLIPHTAEEFWSKMMNSDLISLEDWPSADESAISKEAELSEELVRNTYSDIEHVIELTKKTPKKILLFAAPSWKHEVYKGVLEGKQIKDFVGNPALRKLMDDVVKYYQNISRKKFELRKETLGSAAELEVLTEAKSFFAKEFKCKFEIIAAEKSAHQKAKAADVMKPGIYIE